MWSSSTTGKHLWHAKGDVNYIRWTSEKYLLFIKNEINTLFYVQFLIIFIVLSPTCFDSFRITLRKTYRGIYNFTIILNIVKVTQIIYIYTHIYFLVYPTGRLGFFRTRISGLLLDPEDIKGQSLGAIWNFSKGTRLSWPGIRLRGTKGPFQGLGASEPQGLEPNY